MLKNATPIKTFADWQDDRPGFLEIDLISHCDEGDEAGMLTEAKQQELAAIYHGLNPPALLKQINENLEHLWNLVGRPTQHSLSVLVPDVIPLVNVSNSQI